MRMDAVPALAVTIRPATTPSSGGEAGVSAQLLRVFPTMVGSTGFRVVKHPPMAAPLMLLCACAVALLTRCAVNATSDSGVKISHG